MRRTNEIHQSLLPNPSVSQNNISSVQLISDTLEIVTSSPIENNNNDDNWHDSSDTDVIQEPENDEVDHSDEEINNSTINAVVS